jgi:hypothetical protein
MAIYLPTYSYIIYRFNFLDYMAKQTPIYAYLR